MKKNNQVDVIDLSYYIIFHLQKHHFDITPYDLEEILLCLQEQYVNQYQELLFNDPIEMNESRPEIKRVYEEFKHYGGYPIQSRRTLARRERVFWMRQQMDSSRFAQLTKTINRMTIDPFQEYYELEGPKEFIKRK